MTKTREDQHPMVGIFWWFRGRLIFDASPLNEAEKYGDCATHSRSHIDHWTALQQRHEVPSEIEYEEPPRGRVMWNTFSKRSLILVDRCILRNTNVLNRVMRSMQLSPDNTDTGPDAHYRCARCLQRHWREEEY
jgi:hypothetical protein